MIIIYRKVRFRLEVECFFFRNHSKWVDIFEILCFSPNLTKKYPVSRIFIEITQFFGEIFEWQNFFSLILGICYVNNHPQLKNVHANGKTKNDNSNSNIYLEDWKKVFVFIVIYKGNIYQVSSSSSTSAFSVSFGHLYSKKVESEEANQQPTESKWTSNPKWKRAITSGYFMLHAYVVHRCK